MSWLSRGAGDRGDQPGRDERSGARHLDGGLSGSDPGKAPPPLTARASRPSAVRLRGSAVKVLGAVAALVLAFAFVHAFVLEPARATAPAKRAHKPSEGTVRPTEVITGQPASYDRLAPRLPDPRTQAEAVVPAVAATPAPSATVLSPDRRSDAPAQDTAEAARSSGLFFQGSSTQRRSEPSGMEPSLSSGTAAASGGDYAAAYSPHRLIAPISPFELKAGTLIPAALLTPVDSSRPGPVLAVTTRPVFDTVAGRTLLLPQGVRLLGALAGEASYGERRVHLVWKRAVLPNGKSLLLDDEAAVDGAGASGVAGQVDRRLVQVGAAALFSTAISTLGEIARSGRGRRGSAESLGDALAGQAVQLGGRFLDRELGVRPRIVAPAGAAVNVLITRDIVLEPYP